MSDTPMPLRIAYLINQYPKVSHSFIRREILALEKQGVAIQRLALRGWNEDVVDELDKCERSITRYVLQQGPFRLVSSLVALALTSPIRFANGLKLAVRMSRKSDRSLAHHLIYLAEAAQILPWLKEFGATQLHAHFGTNSAEVAMLANALGGPPYSFTAHGSETVENAEFSGLGEKARHAAFVASVCSFGRSQLYRWVDYEHWSKIKIVHCGLEENFYREASSPSRDSRRFVCVGRLTQGKGQIVLIEAVNNLAKRGINCQLVLAGDGEMRPDIELLIKRYKLENAVQITGWISSDRVRDEILAARALVLASFSEGLPVVIMEAMALATPVLTTFVGGIPELVRNGVDGWLFPAGSVKAVETAMEACLNSNADELTKMGLSARQRVLERHSIDSEARKLIELFKKPIAPQEELA